MRERDWGERMLSLTQMAEGFKEARKAARRGSSTVR